MESEQCGGGMKRKELRYCLEERRMRMTEEEVKVQFSRFNPLTQLREQGKKDQMNGIWIGIR